MYHQLSLYHTVGDFTDRWQEIYGDRITHLFSTHRAFIATTQQDRMSMLLARAAPSEFKGIIHVSYHFSFHPNDANPNRHGREEVAVDLNFLGLKPPLSRHLSSYTTINWWTLLRRWLMKGTVVYLLDK